MYEFLAALPAVLGITGFIVFHLMQKDQKGDEITRRIVAKLRTKRADKDKDAYNGLSPRQLERRIAQDQDTITMVDEQDFKLLRQALSQQFIRGLLVDLIAAVLVVVSIVLFISTRKNDVQSSTQLTISGLLILDTNPRAGSMLVDLDDLQVVWRAEGPPEDVFVSLEGLDSGKKTGERRVSSHQGSILFAVEDYQSILSTREHKKSNRIRTIVRTSRKTFTSGEFDVHVGIKITIVGTDEKVKVMARIDNSPIHFYDFEAKVVIPKRKGVEFLVLDGFKYGKNDTPITNPNELEWNDIRLAYFGPDDTRLVRPEFLGLATGGR